MKDYKRYLIGMFLLTVSVILVLSPAILGTIYYNGWFMLLIVITTPTGALLMKYSVEEYLE